MQRNHWIKTTVRLVTFVMLAHATVWLAVFFAPAGSTTPLDPEEKAP